MNPSPLVIESGSANAWPAVVLIIPGVSGNFLLGPSALCLALWQWPWAHLSSDCSLRQEKAQLGPSSACRPQGTELPEHPPWGTPYHRERQRGACTARNALLQSILSEAVAFARSGASPLDQLCQGPEVRGAECDGVGWELQPGGWGAGVRAGLQAPARPSCCAQHESWGIGVWEGPPQRAQQARGPPRRSLASPAEGPVRESRDVLRPPMLFTPKERGGS